MSIYFIQSENGPIKIGYTRGLPMKRLGSLQTASPGRLKLLKAIEGGLVEEANWHERFAAFRLQGEWFKPEPELLVEIEAAAGIEEVGPAPRERGEARTEVYQLRISPAEKEELFERARLEDTPLSEYIRRRLKLDASEEPTLPAQAVRNQVMAKGVHFDKLVAKHKLRMPLHAAERLARKELEVDGPTPPNHQSDHQG